MQEWQKSAWVTKRNTAHNGISHTNIYASTFPFPIPLFKIVVLSPPHLHTHTLYLSFSFFFVLSNKNSRVMCTSYNSNPSHSNLLLMAHSLLWFAFNKIGPTKCFRLLFHHSYFCLSPLFISQSIYLSPYLSKYIWLVFTFSFRFDSFTLLHSQF